VPFSSEASISCWIFFCIARDSFSCCRPIFSCSRRRHAGLLLAQLSLLPPELSLLPAQLALPAAELALHLAQLFLRLRRLVDLLEERAVAHHVLLPVVPEPEVARPQLAQVAARRFEVARPTAHRSRTVVADDDPRVGLGGENGGGEQHQGAGECLHVGRY
jgi:hypothetical protein